MDLRTRSVRTGRSQNRIEHFGQFAGLKFEFPSYLVADLVGSQQVNIEKESIRGQLCVHNNCFGDSSRLEAIEADAEMCWRKKGRKTEEKPQGAAFDIFRLRVHLCTTVHYHVHLKATFGPLPASGRCSKKARIRMQHVCQLGHKNINPRFWDLPPGLRVSTSRSSNIRPSTSDLKMAHCWVSRRSV